MGWALIEARGTPAPQGSIAFKGMRKGKPIMVSDNASDLKPWREVIGLATRAELGSEFTPLDEPVALTIFFTMPRPKRPQFEVPAVKPDLDKLLRAVFDGLADGGLYRNDSRVFRLDGVGQQYEEPGMGPGVVISALWGDELGLSRRGAGRS